MTLLALARCSCAPDRRGRDRALLLAGVSLGLGLGHHPSLAFASLFFVGYLFVSDRHLIAQPRRWWRLGIAAPVAVVPYLYLPVRGAMGAPLAPPRLHTLQGFLNHALARGFAGDMFAYANTVDLPHRMSLVPTLFRFQFNIPLIVAALLAIALLARADWRLLALLGGSLVVHTFVTITYRAPQTVEYLMPVAYPVIGIAAGLFPGVLGALSRELNPPASAAASALLGAGLIVAGGLNGWAHGPSYVELAQDRTARATVTSLLDRAPDDALILSDWHWVTPLWYLQQVEGMRPDVEVRYVYSEVGEDYRETWRRRVKDAPRQRPLLLTHYYEFDGYTSEPLATGALVRERPVVEPQARLAPVGVTFGRSVRILGFELRPRDQRVGQPVEVTLAWQFVDTVDEAVSLSVRLELEGDQRVSQADRALPADLSPGEVRFERLTLPLYGFLAPGAYTLTLGAYVPSAAGFEDLDDGSGNTVVSLGEVRLSPARATYTAHAHGVPFEAGPVLAGVSYDRSVPGTLRVYAQWRGPVPDGVVATVGDAAGKTASVTVPPVAEGAYQTVVVDLEEPLAGGLSISLSQDGRMLARAGPWGVRGEQAGMARPAPDAVFIPLGGEIAVVGATASPAAPGGDTIVEAQLVGLRPLTTDYAVSIRLTDDEGRWLARHDWQPALGAIPTLKWIRGSRVVDRHLLRVPDNYTGNTVRAELVAYERFREAPLPPMDGRFGEAPLGEWSLPGAPEDS
jgi:hypothetical protein